MRALTTTLLVAGLAFWGSQAAARPRHLPPPSQMSKPAQPAQASPSMPPSQSPPPQQSAPFPAPQSAETQSAAAQPTQPQPGQMQPTQREPSQTQPGRTQLTQPQPSPTESSPPSQPPQPQYSADGLYNLANSYARAGKPGLAVLNYERAALLAPGDPDINANLEYVLTSAHVPPQPRTRVARIVQAAPPTLAAWIGVLGITLVGAALLARKFTPRFRLLRASGALLGIALVALTIANAMLLWPRMHEAIVLVNQAPARVSPVPMGDTAFVLSEAETVIITAKHDDFILVRTRGGLSGWVARTSIAAVVP